MGDVYTQDILNAACCGFLGEQEFSMACDSLHDRYISDMRSALMKTGLAEKLHDAQRTAAEWAKAYAYVTDILPLDPRHFARDPACPLNLAEQDRHRVDVLIGERDAARAEVTELRAKLARCAAAKHAIADARDSFERDKLKIVEQRDKAESERDEARECVRRLQQSAQAVLDRWNSPTWQWYNQGPTASLMNAMRDALAATPEHLRS